MFPACLVRISAGAAYCSGTLLSPNTVLTCAHFFRDVPNGATVRTEGRIRTIIDVKTVPTSDLAVIRIRPFHHLEGARFPEVNVSFMPAPGTPTVTFGYGGHAERMQVRQGRWLAPLPLAISRGRQTLVRPAGLVYNHPPAIKGDSGGPVIAGGEIIGIQSLIFDPWGVNLGIATVNLLPQVVAEFVGAQR